MNGSMHKVENGRYRVRWRDPDEKGRSKTFDRLEDAKRWLAHVRHKTAMNELPLEPMNKISVGGHLVDWWSRKEQELRPRTSSAYESILRLHVPDSLKAQRLTVVTASDIEAALRPLVRQGKFALARKMRAVLSGLFADAVRHGHIVVNPVSHAQMPLRARQTRGNALRTPMECLSPPSVWRIADAVPPWARAIVLVGGFAGLRWGEMAGLGPEHIDLEACTIRVERAFIEPMRELSIAKTPSSIRTAIFSESIVGDLAQHLASYSSAETVFTSRRGERLHHSNFRRRVWLPALQSTNLDGWRYHDLRHTYASILIRGAVSPPLIAQMMGHSNASVTLSVYAGFWDEQSQDVRNALARSSINVPRRRRSRRERIPDHQTGPQMETWH